MGEKIDESNEGAAVGEDDQEKREVGPLGGAGVRLNKERGTGALYEAGEAIVMFEPLGVSA